MVSVWKACSKCVCGEERQACIDVADDGDPSRCEPWLVQTPASTPEVVFVYGRYLQMISECIEEFVHFN